MWCFLAKQPEKYKLLFDLPERLIQAATVPAQNKYKAYVQKPTLRLVNKKPFTAKEAEIKSNRRSRSAKLRFAEKVNA